MQSGLIGAMKVAKFPSAAKVILVMVVAAGVVLVTKKAGVPMNGIDAVVVTLLLGLAALGAEYILSKEMTRLYIERLPGPFALCFVVWAGAFTYGMGQWIGAASENQAEKTGIQKAAYITATQSEKTEAELTKRNNDLMQKIEMAPQRGPDAAAAAIQRAKADRFWERTKGCTENVRGTVTRPFCDAYASAVADLEYGKNVMTWREEQKAIAAELTAVRNKRASQRVVATNDTRNDLRIYTSYLGVSEQAATDMQAIWTIIIISLFLTGLGVLEEAKKYRGQPRKPWPWTVWFRGLMYGQKPATTAEETPTDSPVSAPGNRNDETRAYPQPAWKADIRTVADIQADMRRLAAA